MSSKQKLAVKLITIHKAKGLEFPFVILTELDTRFDFARTHA
jgi:ATP-dependent exoDNAse (exonuclease V) beta subunit